MAHSHDPLDLFRGSGQQHSLRNDAKIRQPVTLVGLQFFLRCDQASVSDDDAEFLEDARVHGIQFWPAASLGSGHPGKQGSASVHKRQTKVLDQRTARVGKQGESRFSRRRRRSRPNSSGLGPRFSRKRATRIGINRASKRRPRRGSVGNAFTYSSLTRSQFFAKYEIPDQRVRPTVKKTRVKLTMWSDVAVGAFTR